VFQRVRIAGVLTLLVVGGVLLVPRALWAKIDNRTGIALTDGSEAQIAAKSRKVVLQGEWSRIWTAVADKFHSDVERKASVGEGPVPLLSGSVVTCREPRSVPAEWLVDRCDRPAQGRCPIETGTDACQFEWAKSVVLDVEKAVGHPPRPGAAWAHLEMPGSEAVEDTAKALGASRAPQVRVDLWEAHVSPPRGEPPRGLWRAKQKEIALLESPDRQLRVKSLGGGGEAAGTGDLQCAPGNALRIEWLTVARGIARPTAITLKRADGSPWATWHLVNGDGGPTLCTPEDGSIPEATVVGIEPAISNQSRLRIVRRDSVLRLELAPLVQHVCYTDDQGERCKGKPTSGTCQQIFKDLPPECSQLWTGCDCST
jgi:hypothetical protein